MPGSRAAKSSIQAGKNRQDQQRGFGKELELVGAALRMTQVEGTNRGIRRQPRRLPQPSGRNPGQP